MTEVLKFSKYWDKIEVFHGFIYVWNYRIHGLPLVSSWNTLHDDITLNNEAMYDEQLEIYLQKWEEKDKNCTTVKFLYSTDEVSELKFTRLYKIS